VSALPPSAVRAIVESEWPGVVAWAGRHDWTVNLDVETLLLHASTQHPAAHRPVEFLAHLDDYKALPPAWHVVVPGTDRDAGKEDFPAPAGTSIFHGNMLVCAPWNRLAYKSVNPQGPHDDWGGPEGWLSVTSQHTTAHTLGDMLAAIDVFLQQSPGMLA
jgi:hypothetical protein